MVDAPTVAAPTSSGRDWVGVGAFLGGSILAGGSGVAVRFSNRELDPLWGAALRFGGASAVLFVIVVVMRLALPRGRALGGAVLFGVLNFGAAFAFAYYALTHIHAGLGQTLLALVPLLTLVLAVAQGQERLRRDAVIGTLLALVGIAIVSRTSLRGDVPPLALLASLASGLCFAEAAVLVRRFPKVHPVTMNAVAMAAGTAALLAGAVVTGATLELPRRPETWAALAYAILPGSVLGFILYLFVLRRWSAARASYVFVVIPVVAVAVSAWLDDEHLGLELVLGGLFVIAGVYVGALRADNRPTFASDAGH